MKEIELTCINCPMGCTLHATLDDAGRPTSVTGNTCPRGKAYAEAELTHPTRTLTTTVRLSNRERPLPVKTNKPISKERLFEAMALVNRTAAEAPVRIGDVIIADFLGEADLIATENVD